MAGYLDRIGAGKVLLDKAPLSYDWVPQSLIGRDEELGEMAGIFSQIENHETSCQAVVMGPVGSGKTVLTLSLIHISEPRDKRQSRMPSSA